MAISLGSDGCLFEALPQPVRRWIFKRFPLREVA